MTGCPDITLKCIRCGAVVADAPLTAVQSKEERVWWVDYEYCDCEDEAEEIEG